MTAQICDVRFTCIKRDGDMLTLRFRDYPKLPTFARHKTAVAFGLP